MIGSEHGVCSGRLALTALFLRDVLELSQSLQDQLDVGLDFRRLVGQLFGLALKSLEKIKTHTTENALI